MRLDQFSIAGGNSTLLVQGYKSSEKKAIIKKYLGLVEQIGFVSFPRGVPKLIMMGNELSVNGTIALASMLSNKSGVFFTSGYLKLVTYRKQKQYTKIKLNLTYKRIENIVLLDGIGYIFLKASKQITKKYLANFCSIYNLPAFGAIFIRKERIYPYVYVKQTDSLFEETACGSASIALNILTGKKSITQPTGKDITVKRIGKKFEISAEVVKKGGF